MILGIYGAGSLGREIYELAEHIQSVSAELLWEQIIFISDVDLGKEIWGIPVLSYQNFKLRFSNELAQIVIGIGEPFDRKCIRERIIRSGYHLATLIHPICRISPRASIAEGCIVNFGCNISYDTIIGTNTYLQPSCGIGHNSKVGEDCVISASARIAGDVLVGNQTYIGLHSAIREGITIGEKVIVGMNSAVQRDIADEFIVAGNPARAIQKNQTHKVFN